MKKILVMAAAVLALPVLALAQKPVTDTETVEVKGTIEAIDHNTREVTLKDETGELDTFQVGPEVKRFAELKVGDTVSARYTVGLVYTVRKPGTPAPAAAAEEVKVTAGKGPKPGATASRQQTATVEVKAVDPKVPSITVVTDDKRTLSFKVKDAKRLEGVKPGDKIDVTYTEALIVSVQ